MVYHCFPLGCSDRAYLNILFRFCRAEFAKDRGEKAAMDGEKVRVQTLDVEDLIREATDESGNAVLEVANLANSLDKGHGPHLESAVSESISHLKDIQNRILDPFIEKAEYEFGNVRISSKVQLQDGLTLKNKNDVDDDFRPHTRETKSKTSPFRSRINR